MWIPVITLAALLGHTSGQFQQPFPQNGFPQNGFPQSGFPQAQSAFPQGAFPQTGFPSFWDTIAQSSNLFSQPKQCVQQVVDAETLLKVVSKIVEDIPNICLSKFKMCGGFDDAARAAPQPQGFPAPPPNFDFDFLFRNPATPESNEMPEEEMVEEVFEDVNGTETKTRHRRSTSYPKPPTYSYGYPKPEYSYGYPSYEYPKPDYSYGYKPKPSYSPSLHYYQPNPAETVNLFDLFYKNPAFKNAYLGHHFSKPAESVPVQVV